MFLDIMHGHLITQAKIFHDSDWRLVIDNDPKHTAKKVQEWLSKNVPKQLPWPSQSPDVNPIENYFGWVKQELVKQRPKTITELSTKLQDIWESINPDFLKPYWSSMVRRCNMVIESNGLAKNY